MEKEKKSDRKPMLLVFNKPIQQYLEYALSRTAYNCRVQTYIQWLSDYYRDKSEGTGVLVLNYSSIPIEEIPAAVKLLDEAIG